MQITKNCVATIHYTLTDNEGKTLDSSVGQDPLAYIQGIGNLIPGLEEQLENKKKGDKLVVKVSPEKGYGVKNPQLIQELEKKMFGEQEVIAGMQFEAGGEQGSQIITVVEVQDDKVVVDGNHALAGVELNFDVEVTDVREATSEELEHGHVHGPGGHQH